MRGSGEDIVNTGSVKYILLDGISHGRENGIHKPLELYASGTVNSSCDHCFPLS